MAAGDASGALPWWRRPGSGPPRTAAHSEAAEHFERALRIVAETDPGVLRDIEELELCLYLGLSRSASQGYGSKAAYDAFVRAHEISDRLPRSPALIPALWGVWSFSLIRGDLFHAATLAGQCGALATDGDVDVTARSAASVVGTQRLFEGRFRKRSGARRREGRSRWRSPSHPPRPEFGQSIPAGDRLVARRSNA